MEFCLHFTILVCLHGVTISQRGTLVLSNLNLGIADHSGRAVSGMNCSNPTRGVDVCVLILCVCGVCG
jgi:hypothetical protein